MAEVGETRVVKVYQIDAVIEGSSGTLDGDTTLDELRTYLKTDKDFTCPQCGTVGTIEEGATVCPTCEGDGFTTVAFEIDPENSVFAYKEVV